MKLSIESLIESLDEILVCSDLHPGAAFHHEFRCDLSLVLPYILLSTKIFRKQNWAEFFLPEKELPIQVCHIDFVEVNDMNVLETAQSQIFKELATKTTSAYHF